MKFQGRAIEGRKPVKLYLPGPYEITFQCVKSDFVLERPKPPLIVKPGVGKVTLDDDPAYKQSLSDWAVKKIHWSILKSVENSGLEFENCIMTEPSTWHKWAEEVEETFGPGVVEQFYVKYQEANSLTEEMMEQARKDFLALQEVGQAK